MFVASSDVYKLYLAAGLRPDGVKDFDTAPETACLAFRISGK
jgi:hypothetical protein